MQVSSRALQRGEGQSRQHISHNLFFNQIGYTVTDYQTFEGTFLNIGEDTGPRFGSHAQNRPGTWVGDQRRLYSFEF